MAIADNYQPDVSTGNGSTVEFTGDWSPLNSAYMRVALELISTGAQTLQTLGVDYTLTFNDSGYVVTMASAPSALYNVVRYREVAIEQGTPYKTTRGYQGGSIENSFDTLTAICQDNRDATNRSITLPVGSTANTSLPSSEANTIIGWNAAGDALENKTNLSTVSLGSGVANFLATPSSANLAAAITDETGSGSLVLGTSPTISAPTLSGTTNLSGGQIAFPATQSASANANTLDDYEEGTWTPAISFQTPGNLAVSYTTQVGSYVKIGKQVTVSCHVLASSFTHTTANLSLIITGLPFTSENISGARWAGVLIFQGVTIATYTNFAAVLSNNSTSVLIAASATATGYTFLQASHVPTGGTPSFIFTLTYNAAS